jgi:hypothetical protein
MAKIAPAKQVKISGRWYNPVWAPQELEAGFGHMRSPIELAAANSQGFQ